MRRSHAVVAAALILGGACAHATPQRAAEFYDDALRKLQRNDSRGAAIQLRNAIEQDNRMLDAHVLLGQTLLKSGDIRGAEAAFEAALKKGLDRSAIALPLAQTYLGLGRPDLVVDRVRADGLAPAAKAEVLALRGSAYAEIGRRSLATQSFADARAADPRSIAPHIAETGMLLAARDFDRAKAVAASATEIAPRNAEAWNIHAAVLHATGDLRGALAAYDRALGLEARHVDARIARAALLIDLKRDGEAESDLTVLRQSAPGEPRAAFLRAILAGRKGDERAVVDALQEVAKLIDSLSPAWLQAHEQLLMLGAMASHGLGQLEKARTYLDHVLIRSPRNLGAKRLFASICMDLKDYQRALPELEALYKAQPDDAQVLSMLGTVHLVQGRYQKAAQLLEAAAARGASADVNRALGFSLLELGRTELGRITLQKVLAANPADVDAAMRLALLYMRENEPRKALQLVEATVARAPTNLALLNYMGVIKTASGDMSGARAAYMQVLRADAAFRPAALNLARLDVSEGRFDDGRRRLTALQAGNPDATDVLVELATLEERAGNPAEAIRHLRKAHDTQRRDPRPGLALVELHMRQLQFDRALAAALDLSARYPAYLPAKLALGIAYQATGDVQNARALYLEAGRMAGLDAVAQLRIARAQLAAGSADAAYSSAQTALQARPDMVEALAFIVEIERQRGGAARAESALQTLRKKYPSAEETSIAAGDLAMSLNRPAAALTAYRAALARQDSAPNAVRIARAHLAAGDAAKGLAFLEGWTAKRPADGYALKGLAEMHLRVGAYKAAGEVYRRLLKIDPNDPAVLNNLANVLDALKDPDAEKYADRALNLVPGHPDYADTLGWILARKGRLDAGLRYLRDARLRSPDNGDVRFHLAYALASASRLDEAREELRAAMAAPRRPADAPELGQLRKQLGI
ncbi:MAG TPA: XrtA/PEP-CTERM system TPR-repeat protein PrsT [Burkholderiales bacterium]|nr:XrtA/PEP-CTERM system TPR-repeat protein PrsT [Burkholderiales bacterium]